MMTPHSLTPEDITTLSSLRDRGFSVCVFTPDELEAAEPEEVENAMCEAGWRQIAFDNS